MILLMMIIGIIVIIDIGISMVMPRYWLIDVMITWHCQRH